MRKLTLRAELILVTMAVLLPIAALSIWQGLASHKYTTALLDDRLIIGALAMAERERDELIIAERTLLILSQNEDVRAMTARCNDRLKPGLLANPGVLNIVRVDASGLVRCSIAPFEPGLSLANEAWWQAGIERRAFSVTAPMLGLIVKRQMLIGMLPVYTAQGENDGSISIGIDFNRLQSSIAGEATAGNERPGIVTLVQGQVVVATSKGVLPQFQPTLASRRVAEATSSDGTVWKYSAAPVFGRGLHAIYATPKQALAARATTLVWESLAIPILAMLLTGLVIWIAASRLIVNWLADLIKLAGQFAAGNYRGDADHYRTAPREIATLSTSLHAMAGAIEQRDAELQAALLAKTRMTLEIHHRVKNNLQLVSSLLHLQTRQIDDPAARASLDQTRARIGALAEIHRLLYEDSNESPDDAIRIGPLLGKLCTQLRVLHRHQDTITLDCQIQDHVVPIDAAIPLSLFAVEAITNAYRHAFPGSRKGIIAFSFTISGEQCQLRVTDNGVGFEQDGKATSMGSQLMSGFAEQLGGTYGVSSAAHTGTKVTLEFSTTRRQSEAEPE